MGRPALGAGPRITRTFHLVEAGYRAAEHHDIANPRLVNVDVTHIAIGP
jgi:hypothetical protein